MARCCTNMIEGDNKPDAIFPDAKLGQGDGRSLRAAQVGDGDGDANVATMTKFGSQPGKLKCDLLAFSSLALLRNRGLTALPAASAADFTAVGVGGTWDYVGGFIQMLGISVS